MLALILAMLFCVAVGAGVVGYVLVEARREGRGGFWTAEGEELIAGARRTGEKVRTRGEQLGRSAAERTGLSAPGGVTDGGGERVRGEQVAGERVVDRGDAEARAAAADGDSASGATTRPADGYRAAS